MSAIWWVLAALILFLIEMITPGLFFFACMAAGALLAGLATWLGVGPGWAWVIFFGSSATLVLVVAPLARRWMKHMPSSPVGLDALAGQRARVIEALDPETGKGQVRLENGALWRAMAEDHIPADTWVQILEVQGTRLRVTIPSELVSPKEPSHA